jgi:uncharacterized protein (TIGR03086 family)
VTTALTGAVELLERALGYTRVVLVGAADADLRAPTPCRDWDLGRLLAHMDDGLDAFAEAAGGVVDVPARGWSPVRIDRLQEKACMLLGAWAGPAPDEVSVGGADIASDLLVMTAALEITVHGWDVSAATGGPARIPEALAERLVRFADLVVDETDRGFRFARPSPMPPDAPADQRLLAFLGRA